MSVGYGGQVLASNASAELLHHELPPGISLGDLKEHRLRGLSGLERLWQVFAAGLAYDFPPLQSLNDIPNNLPSQPTSFVGRKKELGDVKKLLQHTSLLTLIGPGGTGKTRLSIQVAGELLPQYIDGIWLVELAPIFDPLLVPRTTAIAIGLRDEPQRPVIDMLCVAAVDIDPAKAGLDLGHVAGLRRKLGVTVADSVAEALRRARRKPDVAVLCTSSSLKAVLPQVEELARKRLPIVSTTEELSYPWRVNRALARRIDAIARRAKGAVVGTGVNPGFAMDTLPIVLTGICERVDSIRVERVQDASIRRLPFQKKIGAGLTRREFEARVANKTVRVGTSGNKAVLVGTDGRIHGKCSAPFQVHNPGTCMAEQEPADWWKAIVETTRGLLQQTGVKPDQILCVTHCTQLLGILPMSAKTGAMGRAIIWLDSRADVQARRMMRKFIDANMSPVSTKNWRDHVRRGTEPSRVARAVAAMLFSEASDESDTQVAGAEPDTAVDDLDSQNRAITLLKSNLTKREYAILIERARGRTFTQLARKRSMTRETARKIYLELVVKAASLLQDMEE